MLVAVDQCDEILWMHRALYSHMIYGVHHIHIAMPAGGEDEARAFYGRILGLQETPKPQELAKRGGVWFQADGFQIHLGIDKDFRAAVRAHPGLLVRNLDEICA